MEVVCRFFLARFFPLGRTPPRAGGTRPPPAVSASEQLSGSESGSRLVLAGLALLARSAMSSRPFEDGVTVLVERRTGVLGWSAARADCEAVAGTGGSAWVGGRAAGDIGMGGSPNSSRAGVAEAAESPSAPREGAGRLGAALWAAISMGASGGGGTPGPGGAVEVGTLLGSAAPSLPISANPSEPTVIRTGRAAGKRRIPGQVAAV